jgi:drug/metabolite transporter (DMT)-like permease
MLCFFTAVATIPLNQAAALSFTTPLFATMGAALILGEIVRIRRWTAVGVGFLGVVAVLRPGSDMLTPDALLVLAAAVIFAAVMLIVKRLTETEDVVTIVFYQSLLCTGLSLGPALLVWRMPSLPLLGVLAILGGLGTIGWLAWARACKLADTSAIAPLEFAKLPFTAILAYLMFAEIPDQWTWIGAATIFGATAYITHRETKLAR